MRGRLAPVGMACAVVGVGDHDPGVGEGDKERMERARVGAIVRDLGKY